MNLTHQDKSNYLKGLLILIGKDKVIAEQERMLLSEMSYTLGFDPKFCNDAIGELLENEYIIEEPPAFSNKKIAEAFIKDGIKIAFADKELHLYELNWLNAVSDKNGIDPDRGLKEFEYFKSLHTKKNTVFEFEISKIVKV